MRSDAGREVNEAVDVLQTTQRAKRCDLLFELHRSVSGGEGAVCKVQPSLSGVQNCQ